MPMKSWISRMQPFPLYFVLTLSIIYFSVQLLYSHLTHALTLLVDAYHMLCNIIALSGCLIAIKYSNKPLEEECRAKNASQPSLEDSKFIEVNPTKVQTRKSQQQREQSLRNTFGWTRIDVLTMLIVCILMASLYFSLLIEAIQTLVHIDHQDTMHMPASVFFIGVSGLILNALCYYLIGGYTFHQGSFLQINSSGDVVLDSAATAGNVLRSSARRLSRSKRESKMPGLEPKRQGPMEMVRDICSTIFVIVCAAIIYFANDENVSKYIDPIISIISCITVLTVSYHYMKESGLILLQTIPGSIDIEVFKAKLLSNFEDIISVHDLHIWQLTARKTVSTAHIIFKSPEVYTQLQEALEIFFNDHGISIVTIQPEFSVIPADRLEPSNSNKCLYECTKKECLPKICCQPDEEESALLDGIKVISSTQMDEGCCSGEAGGHAIAYKYVAENEAGPSSVPMEMMEIEKVKSCCTTSKGVAEKIVKESSLEMEEEKSVKKDLSDRNEAAATVADENGGSSAKLEVKENAASSSKLEENVNSKLEEVVKDNTKEIVLEKTCGSEDSS